MTTIGGEKGGVSTPGGQKRSECEWGKREVINLNHPFVTLGNQELKFGNEKGFLF